MSPQSSTIIAFHTRNSKQCNVMEHLKTAPMTACNVNVAMQTRFHTRRQVFWGAPRTLFLLDSSDALMHGGAFRVTSRRRIAAWRPQTLLIAWNIFMTQIIYVPIHRVADCRGRYIVPVRGGQCFSSFMPPTILVLVKGGRSVNGSNRGLLAYLLAFAAYTRQQSCRKDGTAVADPNLCFF